MAIVKMAKILIVCHRSQASDLLEDLQQAGIVEILDTQRATISKQWPDLQTEGRRPRDMEETHSRLERAVAFLRPYHTEKTSLFQPLKSVGQERYADVVSGSDALALLDEAEQVSRRLDQLRNDCESDEAMLEMLGPWQAMQTPVEEIGRFRRVTCWTGLIPSQHVAQAAEKIADLGATLQKIGLAGNRHACLIAALKEQAEPVQKVLRSVEYEMVSFEGMQGTVSELTAQYRRRLDEARQKLDQQQARVVELAQQLLKLEILDDHYRNVLSRELIQGAAPTTEQAVLLEGWVRDADYGRLETIVNRFGAASVGRIEIAEDEEKPVEIANTSRSRPFETITRLYGMPHPTDVDPTPFLAPFFAMFFGLCLTDAGYGLVMIAFMWWLLRKIKGDAKFVKMMLICSVTTVVAGALTGGWFGDTIQVFIPQLKGFRNAVMWFDPLEKPMYFFYISLIVGYVQIIFGVGVAFWHKWRSGIKAEAVMDHGTWFVWLNSLTIVGLAKTGVLPGFFGTVFALVAIAPALGIIIFSEREGGWGMRIGMGAYNLFSTVFYVGDVLSYVRLMALGMVTAGFGMAINSIVAQVMDLGLLGWILGAVVFVVGHVFNIANSCLSAFVHSMRLQFVEFFTKFLQGGGREFAPLRKEYRHIQVASSSADLESKQ